MRLTILRHATAGHKGDFAGPDVGRPLDEAGERDAVGLLGVLGRYGVSRLLSSPATRCIQTLGPLAEVLDMPIELWDGLGPDADSSNLEACLTNRAFDRAVLCTHGEVMSPLLETDAFRSLIRTGGLERGALLTKGTAWRLRLTPKGRIIDFNHLVPLTSASKRSARRRASI